MAGQTIGGLFKNQARGEKVLAELQAAGFSTAQISEVEDESTSTPPPKKLGNPISEFFMDHQSSGSDFRDNLAELGMSDADAHYFEDGVARGGALVTVKADARASEAMAILQRNGADLGSMDRSRTAAPETGAALGVGATTADRWDKELTADQSLQLKAERLSIDKVRVASGAVRIRKQVVTEQQSIDVPVSHEELVIERHAVTGGAVGGTIGADETITVPLEREEVRVGKQTFVTEEVEVGKKAVGGVENVSDTVRHEELVVDGDTKTQPPIR
jgi:uncharacterized protein (TIGR02271 family)